MTHFIGAVVVPANIDTSLKRARNARWDYTEIDPDSPALQAYLEEALAEFDENKEVEIWHSREEVIAQSRKEVQEYENGYQRSEFKADPLKYAMEHHSNPEHVKYVSEEFPLKLEWTDEEHYQDGIRYAEEGDVRESDGALRDTYNPLSKWDWWTIGGRWDDQYKDRQGETVKNLLSEVRATRVAINDPANIAELDRINTEIREVKEAFEAKVPGIGWKELDAARAKPLDCKGYIPWWFPFHIVVPSGDTYEWHQQGRMGWFGIKSDEVSESEWLDKLEEILSGLNPNDKLVYIDFHI